MRLWDLNPSMSNSINRTLDEFICISDQQRLFSESEKRIVSSFNDLSYHLIFNSFFFLNLSKI